MYSLWLHPEYAEELRELEGRAGVLGMLLDEGAYRTLRRNPYEGVPSRRGGPIWKIEQVVLVGLLTVVIYYEIKEDQKTIDLLSIVEKPAPKL